MLAFVCYVRPALHHYDDRPDVPLHCLVGIGDFVSFWSASQVLAHGGNPYDASQLAVEQSKLDCQFALTQPYWNPPWLLLLLKPLVNSDPFFASTCLMALSVFALLLAAFLVSNMERHVASNHHLTFAAMVMFIPLVEVLYWGQLGAILTFVFALWWCLVERRRYFLAGIVFAFLSIKPQVLYLLFFWLPIFIYRSRAWSMLLGMLFTATLFLVGTDYLHPFLISDWLANSTNAMHHVLTYRSVNLVGVYRSVLDSWGFSQNVSSLMVIPALSGVTVIVYCSRVVEAEDLKNLILPILCLSVFTAPYLWFHDMMVLSLVPASIVVYTNCKKRSLNEVAILEASTFALALIPGFLPNSFLWLPIAMLWLLHRNKEQRASAS